MANEPVYIMFVNKDEPKRAQEFTNMWYTNITIIKLLGGTYQEHESLFLLTLPCNFL